MSDTELGDGKSKFYCEHEKRWRTYRELKESEHKLKADNERLLKCLQDVVDTSGRTRELVMAEELLAETANKNVELPLRDRNDHAFGIGECFLYQVGTKHECEGILECDDGETWVRFSDWPSQYKLSEFWNVDTDPQITEILDRPPATPNEDK